jgi:hypothetical protein
MTMTFGPMQLLVVGFDGTEPTGRIAAELHALREHDIVRLIDLLVVRKDADGEVTAIEASDLSGAEAAELGALTGALIGLDATGEDATNGAAGMLQDEVWFVADAIPSGTSAAVAVLEHRWAIPLREAVEEAGGTSLADAWLHPDDLAGLGAHLPAAGPSS